MGLGKQEKKEVVSDILFLYTKTKQREDQLTLLAKNALSEVSSLTEDRDKYKRAGLKSQRARKISWRNIW